MELTIRINLDVTPQVMCEPVQITSQAQYERYKEQQRQLIGVAFPYIDVFNLSPQLRFAMFLDDGKMETRAINERGLGLTDDDLIEAIETHGGAINMSGWYAVNGQIKTYRQNLETRKGKFTAVAIITKSEVTDGMRRLAENEGAKILNFADFSGGV